jgi:hypothetical protein
MKCEPADPISTFTEETGKDQEFKVAVRNEYASDNSPLKAKVAILRTEKRSRNFPISRTIG